MELENGTCILCVKKNKVVKPEHLKEIIKIIKSELIKSDFNILEVENVQSSIKLCPICVSKCHQMKVIGNKIHKVKLRDEITKKCVLCRGDTYLIHVEENWNYLNDRIESLTCYKRLEKCRICLECIFYLDVLYSLKEKLNLLQLRPTNKQKAVKEPDTTKKQKVAKEPETAKMKEERRIRRKALKITSTPEELRKSSRRKIHDMSPSESIISISSDMSEGSVNTSRSHIQTPKRPLNRRSLPTNLNTCLRRLTPLKRTRSFSIDADIKSDTKLYDKVPFVLVNNSSQLSQLEPNASINNLKQHKPKRLIKAASLEKTEESSTKSPRRLSFKIKLKPKSKRDKVTYIAIDPKGSFDAELEKEKHGIIKELRINLQKYEDLSLIDTLISGGLVSAFKSNKLKSKRRVTFNDGPDEIIDVVLGQSNEDSSDDAEDRAKNQINTKSILSNKSSNDGEVNEVRVKNRKSRFPKKWSAPADVVNLCGDEDISSVKVNGDNDDEESKEESNDKKLPIKSRKSQVPRRRRGTIYADNPQEQGVDAPKDNSGDEDETSINELNSVESSEDNDEVIEDNGNINKSSPRKQISNNESAIVSNSTKHKDEDKTQSSEDEDSVTADDDKVSNEVETKSVQDEQYGDNAQDEQNDEDSGRNKSKKRRISTDKDVEEENTSLQNKKPKKRRTSTTIEEENKNAELSDEVNEDGDGVDNASGVDNQAKDTIIGERDHETSSSPLVEKKSKKKRANWGPKSRKGRKVDESVVSEDQDEQNDEVSDRKKSKGEKISSEEETEDSSSSIRKRQDRTTSEEEKEDNSDDENANEELKTQTDDVEGSAENESTENHKDKMGSDVEEEESNRDISSPSSEKKSKKKRKNWGPKSRKVGERHNVDDSVLNDEEKESDENSGRKKSKERRESISAEVTLDGSDEENDDSSSSSRKRRMSTNSKEEKKDLEDSDEDTKKDRRSKTDDAAESAENEQMEMQKDKEGSGAEETEDTAVGDSNSPLTEKKSKKKRKNWGPKSRRTNTETNEENTEETSKRKREDEAENEGEFKKLRQNENTNEEGAINEDRSTEQNEENEDTIATSTDEQIVENTGDEEKKVSEAGDNIASKEQCDSENNDSNEAKIDSDEVIVNDLGENGEAGVAETSNEEKETKTDEDLTSQSDSQENDEDISGSQSEPLIAEDESKKSSNVENDDAQAVESNVESEVQNNVENSAENLEKSVDEEPGEREKGSVESVSVTDKTEGSKAADNTSDFVYADLDV